MAVQKHTVSQRDFSAGEVSPRLKRSEDHPIFKTSLRQCSNFTITDEGKLRNRFGRSAKFDLPIAGNGRVEEVLLSPGNIFYLEFTPGALIVRNAAGTVVVSATTKADGITPIPWTANTLQKVVYDTYLLSIYICYGDDYPNNVPQILTWDGVSQTSTWTFSTYSETVLSGGQKRTFFYRLSPQNVTLFPSNLTGSITLTFGAPIATASMVGTRIRYIGRQILITGFTNATTLTGTVEEPLLAAENLSFAVDPRTTFNIGDVVLGATSGAKGIVIASNATTIEVQLLSNTQIVIPQLNYGQGGTSAFVASEPVVGPSGSLANSGISGLIQPTAGTSIWDDELMNSFRGWPTSVTVDQSRLCFMNFPQLPTAIGYSAEGLFFDLYIPLDSVTPSNAILELAPNKSQVLFMVPGQESSEFIFCDNAVYYVPITAAQPLSATAGISFNKMTQEGCAQVQPRLVQEALVYVSAGASTLRAITATGAYQRPYEVRPISKWHDHLFTSPIAIATPSATDPNFPERYIYVLNSDGTVVLGKLEIEDGRLQKAPGWTRMSGNGSVAWVAARGADVVFTTTYSGLGALPVTIIEVQDATQYLDAAIFYNNVPSALTPGGGQGPLWWLANGTVTVMDLGTRQLGLYSVDGNGFLIPQFTGGENLTSSQLVVGQAWTATAEPWIAGAEPGADIQQRMTERNISMAAVAYENSTGFVWQRLYSKKQGPKLPALGSVVVTRRVPTYNQDEDPTQVPILREDVDTWRPGGASYDPRLAIVKDTAGPFTIIEFSSEVSV